MIKSPGMTVTPLRMAMTSPTVPPPTTQHHQHQPQLKSVTSRISNFSVASLLADTRPKSPPLTPTSKNNNNNNNIINNNDLLLSPTNLSISHTSSCSPNSQHNDSSSSIKNNDSELLDRSHTPHSSIESEDYDSVHEEEDSIVDIEDVNNENSTNLDKSPSLIPASALMGGHVPIRPTPFSALAAAAASYGIGSGMLWPGARQMQPFGPPGLFPGQNFPGMQGGECRFLLSIFTLEKINGKFY
jgi:homeobox protein MSX